MKTRILQLMLLGISLSIQPLISFANTTVGPWTPYTGTMECPSELSGDGRTKYGVPSANNPAAVAWGSLSCVTHFYDQNSYRDYQVAINYNGGLTACNAGDRAIGQTAGKIICRKYDDTIPTSADMTFSCPAANILATNSYPINVSGTSNGGGVITSISLKYTDYSNPSATVINTSGFAVGSPTSTLSPTINVSNVDLNRQSYGGRPYALDVTMTDDAGNSYTKNCNFNVYANSTNILASSNNDSSLISGNIAQGDIGMLNVYVTDVYGNILIPVSGISRTISAVTLKANNTMYLDQRNRSGASSVFISDQSNSYSHFPIGSTAASSFGGQASNNGNYPFYFKVYTPTANSYTLSDGPISDTSAKFILSNIAVTSSDSLGGATASAAIGAGVPFVYRPLYTSNITGELRDQGGFIEGVIQKSYIGVNNNGSRSVTSPAVRLEYSGTDSAKFNMYAGTISGYASSNQIFGTPANIVNSVSFPSTSNDLYSRLVQSSGTVGKTSKIYLSSHIAYTLDGLSIQYNSDIIGKDSYFGTEGTMGSQAGVRVIGATYSSAANETVGGQLGGDINILDNTKNKNAIRTQLKKNGYALVQGANIGNQSSLSVSKLDGTNAFGRNIAISSNSSVLYFGKLNSSDVVTVGSMGDININGKRAIITIGGNIYIKNNITYGNKTTDKLSIIALEDANGNGGNVYIDPGVVNISAVIYADKSVLSYDTLHGEIDGSSMASILQNQLYIYGALVSQNTIGGARSNKCPLFISSASCTQQIAQKFDLNYLRRYHLININGYTTIYQYSTARTIGGGTCDAYGNCSGQTISTLRNFSDTTSPYAQYPAIIDYDSSISSNPPIGFTAGK